ncbi:MAG TPA: hypothetical protein PLJ50_09330, partial [Candidatus Latescibacteria bacterium]|nr:hypothetical protein [Candidatus Latescibacterota bacterium]
SERRLSDQFATRRPAEAAGLKGGALDRKDPTKRVPPSAPKKKTGQAIEPALGGPACPITRSGIRAIYSLNR